MSVLFALLITLSLAVSAWGQAPPTTARTVDGNTVCQPSYQFQYPNGSLTCGTVGGLPTAIVNLGATPGTLPWSSVTSATSTQTMTMSGAGSMRPLGGGTIEANLLQTGTVNLTGPTNAGMTASGMYVGDAAAGSLKIVNILECDDITQKLKWNTTTRVWQCITDQGGMASGLVTVTTNDTTPGVLNDKIVAGTGIAKSINNPGANESLELAATPPFSTLTPDTNTTAGNYIFGGTANFDVQSQLRIPSSTSPPAVDRELKIAEAGDGTLVNKPQIAFQFGAVNIFVPAPLALPTADAQALTYNVATQEYVWRRPSTVAVSAVDTTPNYLSAKLVAGANITLTPSGAGNETLTIASTGGGAGNPGGVNQNMQYNNNGSFGGFGTFNNATNEATFPGTVAAGGTGAPGQLDLPNTARTFNNSFIAPATSTANRSCQLLDAAAMIPASCVQGGGGATVTTERKYFDAAGCVGGTATLNWNDDPNAAEPTAACFTSGAKSIGVANFADNAENCMIRSFQLSNDVTNYGAFALNVIWRAAATTGDVRWTVQTMCEAIGEDATTFNAVGANDFMVDTAQGVTNTRNAATASPITTTGCANLEQLYLRVCRDGANAADTMVGVAQAQGIELVYQRTHP